MTDTCRCRGLMVFHQAFVPLDISQVCQFCGLLFHCHRTPRTTPLKKFAGGRNPLLALRIRSNKRDVQAHHASEAASSRHQEVWALKFQLTTKSNGYEEVWLGYARLANNGLEQWTSVYELPKTRSSSEVRKQVSRIAGGPQQGATRQSDGPWTEGFCGEQWTLCRLFTQGYS